MLKHVKTYTATQARYQDWMEKADTIRQMEEHGKVRLLEDGTILWSLARSQGEVKGALKKLGMLLVESTPRRARKVGKKACAVNPNQDYQAAILNAQLKIAQRQSEIDEYANVPGYAGRVNFLAKMVAESKEYIKACEREIARGAHAA